jgi:hypothetical protein
MDRTLFPDFEQGSAASDADVRGGPLPCGHYIAEEAPDRLRAEVLPFFASGD